MKYFTAVILFCVSQISLADAIFEGTIKEIYFHHRDINPYIGIVVDGNWISNSCGTSDRFIAHSDSIPKKMLAMLLVAKSSSQTVELRSTESNPQCYNNTTVYPILNFVNIK